jgi:Zn-dependent peptidase ImmA (M78 family)
MPGEEIPVTPNLISWARKRAGLTLEEAKEKFRHIDAWEAGKAFPTYPQLELLADEFRVPVAVFFFPEPPNVPPIRESFRTLPDTEFNRIPRRVTYLLRKAKALQLNLAELSQGQNPSSKLITRDLEFTARSSVDVMAARARGFLGISLDQQVTWRNDEEAFKAWRKALLNVGIFVFKDAFRVENYSGFSLYDDVFPIIYVNNSAATTRQIFTLFHELAHLLFRTSGIDTLDNRYVDDLPERQKQIEVMCNRFAAQFLVPAEAFAEALRGHEPSERTAEYLAARFHVSREFIYRKFLDRGLIEQDDYTQAAQRWKKQKQAGSGGDPYRSKLTYLGRDYVALAFNQYYQNKIDDTKLGEYLDMKPKNVGTLEEYFVKGGR